MIRSIRTLALLSMATVMGCSMFESKGPLAETPSTEQQAQLAAYAARNEFPADTTPSTDLKAATVVSRNTDQITIRNYSDKTLHNVKIWINGAYVRELDTLPAHGSIMMNRGQFFSSSGRSLKSQNVSVDRVYIQSDGNLYQLQGPQFE